MGTDEAARLCERTGAQLSLTVNVLWFKDDYARGAKLAADWVEYCNAPNDGRNPNGGVDWARVRALNGHPRPYNVRLWEIGNETWLLPNFPMEPYGKQVAAYANAMRAVDPRIEIIADGQNPVLQDSVAKYAGRRVQYIAFHHYEPWAVDLTGLTPEQTWNAAASLPTQPWEDWLARMTDYVRRTHMGYKVALTEWNTHGWSQHGDWTPRAWPPALPKYVPFSLGLAAWLNDLIRHADLIPIADASLLAGREWSNSLIRYGWDENKPAFGFLGYWVLRLYAHHTGDRWLPTRISGGKTFSNPLPFGESRPRASVPYLDVAATRNARTLFLNVVNRSANDEQPVVFHLASFGLPNGATGAATMMRPATTMADPSFDAPNAGGLKTFPVRVVNGALKFAAPSHSVCIIALPLGRATVGKKIVPWIIWRNTSVRI